MELLITYIVSKTTRVPHRKREIAMKRGELTMRGLWSDDNTHTVIRQQIRALNPGWSIAGYANIAKASVSYNIEDGLQFKKIN